MQEKVMEQSCRQAPALAENPAPQKTDRLAQSFDSIRKYMFITGSALLVFIALRNSLTWHLQRFWGASGNFWQYRWEQVYDYWEGDAWTLAVIGTVVVTTIPYWLFASMFLFIDYTGKPAFLLKYKTQPEKNAPVDPVRFRNAILTVIFNQTVFSVPFICVMYHIYTWRGVDFGRELPTFQWVIFELVVFNLVEEFGFYYTHRTLHHPALYKHIHKLHHEWTAPISVISLYAHPVEHILSNMLPPMLGPLIMGSHIATSWLWFVIALLSTNVAHCGYHFPLLPSPEAHDFHHLKFTNNFGVLGVLDRLHGTDEQFRASKAYQRHFMLLSLTPVSQQFPDSPKKKSE
ncbi:fatty acid hydroxylase domain-containing protein 2-like [Saccoglossus kowalevskii]|uniref:Fatty acid hydroxylase domain-containing protein 2-like n=1 Tax=Saccoglossus kowalevskii TaxID=10224 RepID=A0ABM0GNS5_SACKO|nr:PREDICTED: fatty acid hydroxylase domain-containing protein 2-like [Saccoglossus kowalevskii]